MSRSSWPEMRFRRTTPVDDQPSENGRVQVRLRDPEESAVRPSLRRLARPLPLVGVLLVVVALAGYWSVYSATTHRTPVLVAAHDLQAGAQRATTYLELVLDEHEPALEVFNHPFAHAAARGLSSAHGGPRRKRARCGLSAINRIPHRCSLLPQPRPSVHERRSDLMHFTLAQAVACVATFGGAWAVVRAGAAKGVLKVNAPARCPACGRQMVWGPLPLHRPPEETPLTNRRLCSSTSLTESCSAAARSDDSQHRIEPPPPRMRLHSRTRSDVREAPTS